MSTLEERYEAIRARVPAGVKLVAVSKTRSVEEIQALYDLGQRAFGENYPQELRDKQPALPADIEWHFIGHLQTNKVKYLAPFVHLVHAVDSGKLMQELEKRAAANDRTIGALLQVHIADEETKHGLTPDELLEAVRSWPWNEWPHVEVRGLMAMATFTDDLVQVRREFDAVARLF
ncbi:MAG: YggS family pyridoxal phosphate-dependent enzyme, partial [Lewinella sp.]|nr:YggS family pyridoxal phosphate-dependent enzyme [Lewinella sp.]